MCRCEPPPCNTKTSGEPLLTCRNVVVVEEGTEVRRAIGRNRVPKFDLIAVTCAGIAWIGIGMMRTSAAWWAWIVAGTAIITISWLVPSVVITPQGVRLPRRFTFIPWVEVTKVFQPGPGDPVRIQLSNGKRVTLYGVDRDRVPGIVVLARKHLDGADTSVNSRPSQSAG